MKQEITLLWFKRDLRIEDNEALNYALEKDENIIALYIFEPSQEYNYDFDYRHWYYVNSSILELNDKIYINKIYAEAYDIFNELEKNYSIKRVISHQETGNQESYKRDIKVKSFFKKNNIPWFEFQSNGVIRALRDNSQWDRLWLAHMSKKIKSYHVDKKRFLELNYSLPSKIEEKFDFTFEVTPGETSAHKMLNTFLNEKVDNYFSSISYPEKSRYHSSRLSAYIAWGNISIRQIYQECIRTKCKINNKKSLNQFIARLKWHCHFIQKLEREPELEFKNLNSAFDHIREKKNKAYIKAWKEGRTGFPLIDASMRCVQETGYLNFRLRATVVSFLTHLLWQDWRHGSGHLAKAFLDYEPGIHFSQFQMQAGTVGTHTIRVYNPVKQSLEKDKEAVFISKWVPELDKLPKELKHEPWKITKMEEEMYSFDIKRDYFERIIEHEDRIKKSQKNLYSIKNSRDAKLKSKRLITKHVSRKKSWRR